MMVMHADPNDNASSLHDPLLPWLLSIKKALDSSISSFALNKILLDCIETFKHNPQYKNDPRFLKIWLLYLEGSDDFENVFKEMEENNICRGNSLLYELYAGFLEAKEKWKEAYMVYQTGILRKAEPLARLERAKVLFLDRLSYRINASSLQKTDYTEPMEMEKRRVNPWSASTTKELLEKINPQMMKYAGYHPSKKAYSGDVALSSLQNSSRNKIVKIGGRKYEIKGCPVKGGFAQVYKAYVNSNPDEVVALKIQRPPFPWEFHMYRQLDQRIPENQSSSFGYVHRLHLFSDYSILVCDYLSHGTLQDVINSYAVTGKPMEEVLCIYYTIEMLHMLETLHGVGIIHGDFKPDNLLIRYSRSNLTEDGFKERSGPWRDQGLCLVDWGRGIDLHLFPDDIEFEGDCRTSGFRCVEMQERKPWTFQVDTYGLCVVIHMMLHHSYMEIVKKGTSDGGYVYLPKAPFKRYWSDLWKDLFTKLLNNNCGNDCELLRSLRKSFEDYLHSDDKLLRKLKELLAKQRLLLCSA
ncbi:MITOTIC CHECKPOINT SERINE/THREONINE-PROTEIN KINASE BUB1 [Salix koriyanagi]|uniref:MITOTIC CHECKPOINT SERINE/THREONINE-PROTEIN KINASE BUB1 n=2 Tax=Salix koriyanagi TaxID=2511006 RepID=A0A9Q0ZGU3_9ROSI|nr:MITOTIC CHECKPOINT SERINE/THREONINE-PROTEIN KINASE BUB1 [Salix koriyanagi]KAJ6733994.1 MITOTIC CHECKPOINT SERINE/THREONINE-PROTEIN KINASE BUB1 [Salix koriyanagi]